MIYDYTVTTGKGEQLNLSDYKGKVIMVVNTATGCGFTPQYAPIEQMYKDYHDKGLEIPRVLHCSLQHHFPADEEAGYQMELHQVHHRPRR